MRVNLGPKDIFTAHFRACVQAVYKNIPIWRNMLMVLKSSQRETKGETEEVDMIVEIKLIYQHSYCLPQHTHTHAQLSPLSLWWAVSRCKFLKT